MSFDQHLPTVVNGEIAHLSVSSLQLGDIRVGGCLKKWWLEKVAHFKRLDTRQTLAGKALHKEIETYLLTGSKMLSALAMRGLPIIPDPVSIGSNGQPDVLVEHPIGDGKLTADGILLLGYIDCVNFRGTNKGVEDVTTIHDPDGTIEVLDWKWKGDGSKSQYYLNPAELVTSLQMAGYGVWIGNTYNPRHIRLSHGYFPEINGHPKKVTKLHVIDDCRRTWEYADELARTLRDVARATSVEQVTGNRHACDKFGGCAHRKTCSTYQKNVETYTMAVLFGETASKDITMGLLSTIAPTTTTPILQQLAQEEANQRAQAAQTSAGNYPGFAEAWATIERASQVYGLPPLAGQAAALKAALTGIQITTGAGLAGSGQLGSIPAISDPALVLQLAGELASAAPAQPAPVASTPVPVQHVQHTTQAVGILPPDAPTHNLATAAKPVEGFTLPGVTVTAPIPAAVIALPTEAPKKRGRRSKAEIEVANAATVTIPAATTTNSQSVSTAFDADSAIFVDCIPNGEFESLHPYVDRVCSLINERFNNAPGALQDVRCAPNDGPLGYGKWAGGLRATVVDCPPPAGTYYLNSADPLALEVANAMRTLCERTGALYVKGIR